MVMQGIVSIQTGEDVVTDKLHIQQFIQNADKKFYSSVVESMESQKKKFTLEPITVDATEEEIKEGAPKQWEMPVSFDQSNFFV
jgi:peptide subunit release factor 1 (eRF1)